MRYCSLKHQRVYATFFLQAPHHGPVIVMGFGVLRDNRSRKLFGIAYQQNTLELILKAINVSASTDCAASSTTKLSTGLMGLKSCTLQSVSCVDKSSVCR